MDAESTEMTTITILQLSEDIVLYKYSCNITAKELKLKYKLVMPKEDELLKSFTPIKEGISILMCGEEKSHGTSLYQEEQNCTKPSAVRWYGSLAP